MSDVKADAVLDSSHCSALIPVETVGLLWGGGDSDRGSTYTAIRFADNGIAQPMGSVGYSYDNPLMEIFFSILKTELVDRNSHHYRERPRLASTASADRSPEVAASASDGTSSW